MIGKRSFSTETTKLFDNFDDTSAEEFRQKALSGEFKTDEEAIEFIRKQLKRDFPDLNLYPDLEL